MFIELNGVQIFYEKRGEGRPLGTTPRGGVKIPARISPRERRGGHTHKKKKSNGVLTPAGN